ncbi:MAG: arylsulfatase [Candidatus Cyclobacteriaceae bacterium M3_2C_046]
MKKFNYKLVFAALIASFMIACESDSSSNKADAVNKKPNIVYILADDLGYGDLGCYGQELIRTPELDKMASEGMKFTQHYSGSTVCAPSRSSLMTGQHTGHTPIRGNKEVKPEGQWPMPDQTFTLPEMAIQQGYVTGAFGKWGLGFPGSEGDPNQQGFQEFFGYNCQRIAHNYYPFSLWDNQEKVMLTGNEGRQEDEYAPDLIHEQALEFIEQNKDTSFFLFLPYVIPHAELKVPDDSILASYEGEFPETPWQGTDEGPGYKTGAYGSQEQPHATFAAMVTRLDLQVGQIIQKLEDLGIAENTLVIFTSDNGPHLEGGADPDFFDSNGPLKGYKRDLYEGGIRVPMIAWWPEKIKAGSETDHISAFWDILPTVADLIGATPPENIDGISFLPTLLGQENQPVHDYLYWEFHERGGRLAVRKGKWKAVKYDVLDDPAAAIELYDLSRDLGEENNVADEYPEIVEAMQEIMQQAHEPSEVFTFNSPTIIN